MKIILTVGCLLISGFVYAQKPPIKFGKIDESLVRMKTHPLDTSADAVVLMDYGNTRFRYDQTSGFLFEFTRIVRIKIFKKDGLKYGDFKTSYYHNSKAHESIGAVKGYTYNYENDKVVKSKLQKSSIFKEETNDNWDEIRISMPDIKQGSIVELTYTLTSPFTWNLQTWVFQSDIPTIHSEYIADIPEYFDYQLLFSGYHPLTINERKSSAGVITYQSKERVPNGSLGNVKSEYSSQNINYKNNGYRWVALNVPAFKLEPYVASPSDYISKIRFELRGTQFPNQMYDQYMGTWKSLNQSFLEHSRFGDLIDFTGYMKSDLRLISLMSNDTEKVESLVELVRNHFEWNGNYSKYASSSLRKAWAEKRGNSADINLTIVAGLKNLGFKADPVLISTRGHGKIRDQYAISSQFNSVIVRVRLEDGTLLLDGTDRFLPIGVLPKKCLNGKGWKVSKTTPCWVEINPTTMQEKIVQATFELEPSGSLNGAIEITDKGYSGYSYHKQLELKGEDKLLDDFQQNNNHWLIEEYEYNSESKYTEPFKSNYVVELNEELTVAGERIYFNPTINEIMKESPFKLEKREYPVDFAYPLSNAYMFKFIIPNGFEVEELPEPVVFAMPNNGGEFTYKISTITNALQLTVEFRINKSLFTQTEYPLLKQFYHQVVQKCEEQVVLKKSS